MFIIILKYLKRIEQDLTSLFSKIRQLLVRVWRGLTWAALMLAVALMLRYSVFPVNTTWGRLALLTGDQHFDFIGWELEAIEAKAAQAMWGAHPFMTEAERSATVRAYFNDIARAQRFEADIDAIYTDPAQTDPAAASAELRVGRDALRADLARRQSLAEAILEGQVAAVLIDEGFGLGGQLVPPIAMRVTPLPNLLVISPRDRIEFAQGVNLDPLTLEQRVALEGRIADDFDMAALVVPLGGIALYPAMVLESSDLQWTAETFAHEWLHHYFFMYPLGWALDFTDPAWHINETAASLFGVEVGRKVMAKYYSDDSEVMSDEFKTARRRTMRRPVPLLKPTEAGCSVRDSGCRWTVAFRQDFDFGATMHDTRVRVDALLSEGRVDEAEAYMEQRRALFFANGYRIRKLNQAYFAFYGGYQVDGIPGIAGEDPTGPAIQAIRDASPDLATFAYTLSSITTREALLARAEGG